MFDDNNKIEAETKGSLDFYKDLLKSYIIDKKLPSKILHQEIERYINVFSLYMQYTNNAYTYNLPYLSCQNKKFAKFLITASKKCELLCDVTKLIRNSDAMQQFIRDNQTIIKDMKISINEFLTTNLTGEIFFHNSFSLEGAERDTHKDILTINYKEQVRSRKLACLNHEQIIKMAIGILENYQKWEVKADENT